MTPARPTTACLRVLVLDVGSTLRKGSGTMSRRDGNAKRLLDIIGLASRPKPFQLGNSSIIFEPRLRAGLRCSTEACRGLQGFAVQQAPLPNVEQCLTLFRLPGSLQNRLGLSTAEVKLDDRIRPFNG